MLDEQHQMYLNRLHHIAVEIEEYEHHYHWLDDSYLQGKKHHSSLLLLRISLVEHTEII